MAAKLRGVADLSTPKNSSEIAARSCWRRGSWEESEDEERNMSVLHDQVILPKRSGRLSKSDSFSY
jgi:hypothetical protein